MRKCRWCGSTKDFTYLKKTGIVYCGNCGGFERVPDEQDVRKMKNQALETIIDGSQTFKKL
tara:strand:+ start:689 stop:871 length:183 start_codon:yes stop_codon:yes gene_type:complete